MLRLLAFLVLLSTPAAAHGWYDNACCNERDCRQTTLGEVERHDDGWYVVPLKVLLPYDDKRLRHSQDALIHICMAPLDKIRCLYVPDIAG